ncbi:YhdP family protein [Achromobacter insolitus]|uniref:YhdP family protein n=1 Tax=Achromobacter insolitus TaxID=217204 RepID=UPI0034507200|nr:uncharacterized protein (TIGR02099 family) [Achromobacter insolitus]
MSVSKKVLCWVFWAVLTVYGVVALGLLGVRYWVLPRVDQWRPQIEAYVSQALGSRVAIGSIQANWQGLNPKLDLASVQVYDDEAAPVLSLPSVSAVLGWRSILALSPKLLRLQLERPELILRRDRSNHLWVAGQDIDLNASDQRSDLDHPALRWLGAQRELRIRGATIRWQDELRGAPELTLSGVNFLARNGSLSHRFVLKAAAGDALARNVELRGEFNRSLFSVNAANPGNWGGQLYVQLDDAEPLAWRPWLDVPAVAGRLSGRAWLQLERGKFTDLTVDTAARGVQWAQTPQGAEAPGFKVGYLQARLQGLPGDFMQLDSVPLARSPGAPAVSVNGKVEQLALSLPGVFEQPDLAVREVALEAAIKGPDADHWFVDVGQLQLVNDDLDVRVQGQWRPEGKTAAGSVDMHGVMARGSMSAIHRYLPLEVNADAREWLAVGLPAGEMQSASITLKGDLDEFPFGAPASQGEFVIAGAFSGAKVDYAPARERRKGWPMLENLSGNFRIDKVSLALDSAGGAVAHTGSGHTVTLGAVAASIPNMEENSELLLTGETAGTVPAYLALAANSPLGELLDGALDEARGTGDWRVGLKLKVPLLNTDDTEVQGNILFAGNTFTFMPEMPLLSQMHGDLAFSEKGVEAKDLRAQFLGGPARIFGRLAQSTDALRFEGTLAGPALTQLSNTPSMSRFTGKAAYKGKVGYQRGGAVDISVESDLVGMAIDMPAPVGKAAQASQLLKVEWSPAQDRGAQNRRWLTASLGDGVNALFERAPSEGGSSYFARGALGINRPASLPERGFSLNASLPELDLDAWENVSDGFSAPAGKGRPAPKPMLPAAERISLATGVLRTGGFTLNDMTLYATRPGPAQWRVDLQSKQATGSLEWREASGAIAGQITARLKHLSLGGEGDTNEADEALSSGSDLSDIPAIDLQAKEFLLYGKNVGELQVLGTNLQRGRQWRLDKLSIVNEAASLNATGNWNLEGQNRGLTVDASAKFEDVGKFLDRIGFEKVVSGGTGTMQGKATWRNLPWTHKIEDLTGEVDVSLDKGRFMHVNSRTARLLELLSLQSLQRLARLDVNPTNLLRDGFPFDTIRGKVKLADGTASTEGYKINGPVAAIVLAGGVNIIRERWDMKAVVIPNLDASGAAMVTALAVNPLIGLGAFVTQWLLKQPLARAMTMEYAVTGSWDDPKIEPIDASGKPAGNKQTPRPAPQPGTLEEFMGGQ